MHCKVLLLVISVVRAMQCHKVPICLPAAENITMQVVLHRIEADIHDEYGTQTAL